MGMGYAAAFVIEITMEDLEKLKLPEHKAFIQYLMKNEIDINEFAQKVQFIDIDEKDNDDDEDLFTKAFDKYIALSQAFKTKYGVGLYLGYHDSNDDGSRYDDIDGVYYTLEFNDVYKLSEEAEKLKKVAPFEIKQFVQYG